MVSLYFGRHFRTRLGVAISEVSGPPVFHIKVGRPAKCLAQGRNKRINLPACSPQPPLNAERQAGSAIKFQNVFKQSNRQMLSYHPS